MTNCGKFDLHVEWELKSQPPPVTPPTPTGKAATKPRSAAKDAAVQAAAAPIFLFEPKVFLHTLKSSSSSTRRITGISTLCGSSERLTLLTPQG